MTLRTGDGVTVKVEVGLIVDPGRLMPPGIPIDFDELEGRDFRLFRELEQMHYSRAARRIR